MGLCEWSCFSEGSRSVALWAVAPGEDWDLLEHQSARRLFSRNSKQVLPQLLEETSPLALGMKMAPGHNCTSHLLRLRQEAVSLSSDSMTAMTRVWEALKQGTP